MLTQCYSGVMDDILNNVQMMVALSNRLKRRRPLLLMCLFTTLNIDIVLAGNTAQIDSSKQSQREGIILRSVATVKDVAYDYIPLGESMGGGNYSATDIKRQLSRASARKKSRVTGMEYSYEFITESGVHKWPYREQVAIVEGNISIGGLMMVHERDEKMICGKIMPQGGLQATEVMLYTIDIINKHEVIPGIRLGARIKDDCDRDIYGLEQSVDFIRGKIVYTGGKTLDIPKDVSSLTGTNNDSFCVHEN